MSQPVLERTLIFSLSAVFIAEQLTGWEPLAAVLGILVFLAIALLLPQLRGMTLWLSASFLAAGVLLFLLQGADAGYWLEAAGINVTLVTLFVFAPLFGIPVRLPAYMEALNRFYETKLRSRTALYAGSQLLTQIMGVFLNVGSIPVVYHIVHARPHPGMSRLLANALNRGFAGAILWSPYFAAMAVVLSSLSLAWSAILPYMLGLSLLSLLVSLAVDARGLRDAERTVRSGKAAEQAHVLAQQVQASQAQAQGQTQQVQAPQALAQAQEQAQAGARGGPAFPAELAVYLATAIAGIVVLESIVDLPMVLITCIAAVLIPLAWCAAKRSLFTYRQGLANHVTVTLPALKKEMTLFLAAGFFSGSVGATGFGEAVPALLERIPLPVSLSFSLLTVTLLAVTSTAGLHPIVLITVLAAGVDPAAAHMSPEAFAVLLLGSWALSNPLSPASAVNNLLAGLYKKPVHELAWSNLAFAALMAAILVIYLAALRI